MKEPRTCIRLACLDCDNEECDGITPAKLKKLIDSGEWESVSEVATWQDTVTFDNQDSSWWTHLGRCPHCLADDRAADAAEEKQQALF